MKNKKPAWRQLVVLENVPDQNITNMKSNLWKYQGFDEGWGIFVTDEGLRILKLDDPPAARPEDCTCDKYPTFKGDFSACPVCRKMGFRVNVGLTPVFDDDEVALLYVISQAQKGSLYHKQAMADLVGLPIPKQKRKRKKQTNYKELWIALNK